MKKAAASSRRVINALPPPAIALPPRLARPWWPWLALLTLGLTAGAVTAALLLWPSGDPKAPPPGPAPEGMVWIPPGTFRMGSDSELFDDAGPVHTVEITRGFWMDATEVTNEQFAAFVQATGYKTIAERRPRLEDFPRWLPEEEKQKVRDAKPFSLVFTPPAECPPDLRDCNRWWRVVHGACWKHPQGPGSDLQGKGKHPVVHIAHDDALAYCEWAGKRLPTEAEWEYAARGGLDGKPYYWGDEPRPGGKWMANIWQGEFPCGNTADDGFAGTSPAGSFPANGYGLYDMAGNAWEWCADYYQPGFEVPRDGRRADPQGPLLSIDPSGMNEVKRVQRGGSYLCSDVYCARYRAGGRMHGEPRTSLSHLGLRCVKTPGGGK